MRIAIDAGHGYNTPGKRTCPFDDGRQMREHEFDRDVAFILADKLKNDGHEVVLCFDYIGITDVSLSERCNIANNSNADIFISVHANAYGNGKEWNDVNGLVAMYYSDKGNELAHKILPALAKSTDMPINSYQKAYYYVLRNTKMPAVIIECGFMTNKSDAKKLLDYNYREKCAQGIYNGIKEPKEQKSSKTSETYRYVKDYNVEIITIDKMALGTAKVFDSAENLSEQYQNFINGMFYEPDSNRLHDLCIYNEEYLEYKEWYTKPKGTFYIYTDGRIGTVTLSKIPTKDVKFLIQGINLSPGADGGSINLREGMDRQGWDKVSDTFQTKRAAIGYDYRIDKVVIIIKYCNLHELRREVRNRGLTDKDNNTVAIALDAGDSFGLALEGNVIYDTSRYMRNIIFW